VRLIWACRFGARVGPQDQAWDGYEKAEEEGATIRGQAAEVERPQSQAESKPRGTLRVRLFVVAAAMAQHHLAGFGLYGCGSRAQCSQPFLTTRCLGDGAAATWSWSGVGVLDL
jgi:hypothetical protein